MNPIIQEIPDDVRMPNSGVKVIIMIPFVVMVRIRHST